MASNNKHTPEGLLSYSQYYAFSAEHLNSIPSPKTNIPQLFLVLHSLELSLKSFLIIQGVEESILSRKPFGHNLEHCLNESISRGLLKDKGLSTLEKQAMEVASNVFSNKELSYLYEYPKCLPDYEVIHKLNQRILNAVFDILSVKYL